MNETLSPQQIDIIEWLAGGCRVTTAALAI
jgi:hypothetical protein